MIQSDNPDINLVPQKKFEEQPTTKKFYLWMVGIGRLIVISTELIAVLVWLSRFRLDYEITTLQENIEEKSATVARSDRFESNLVKYQKKTEEINNILADKINLSAGINKIRELTPTGIRLLKVSMEKQQVELQAICSSGITFAQFIAGLSLDNNIQEIVLNNSRYNETNQSYLIDLSLKLDGGFFK